MAVKSLRAAHSADTRGALVSAARRLYGRRGYASVSLDEVCAQAGVTKGALYHHFANKEDLFVAVLSQVEADFERAGAAAVSPGTDLPSALLGAGRAFLEVCARPDNRRIVVEAPAVLGWQRCREVEGGHALGLLRDALEHAVASGQLECDAPAVLAQLLVAMFNEAGMVVATAADTEGAARQAVAELERLLRGLRPQ
ncbi:MAG: TetR/AcrR family transcriptional regulator [Acidimicrobiales bacterium]